MAAARARESLVRKPINIISYTGKMFSFYLNLSRLGIY